LKPLSLSFRLPFSVALLRRMNVRNHSEESRRLDSTRCWIQPSQRFGEVGQAAMTEYIKDF